MIEPDNNIFPNNIAILLETRVQLLDADLFVIKRPLRNSDPNQSVGVFASLWSPNEDSHEFLGQVHAVRPTVQRYACTIQAFVKDMDEERGLNTHSALSGAIRTMLYNDEPLRIALGTLQSNLNGVIEQAQRWGITQQRYFANEISGEWLYLSVLEFWLETESR